MNNKVSVIITTYKRNAQTLNRALQSVIRQSYKNIEIIVVDDNVDINYQEMVKNCVKAYELDNLHYLVNSVYHGACNARNIGASKSQGKFLAFLDDDDEWDEKKIEKMLPFFDDETGLVFCGFSCFREEKLIRKIILQDKIKYLNDSLFYILKENFIGGCSVPIMTRDAFESVGGFDISFPASQDIDLWIRIIKKYKIKYCDQDLVHYYISQNSITRDLDKQMIGWKKLLDKYNNDFIKYPNLIDIKKNRIITNMILKKNFFQALSIYYDSYHESMKLFKYFPVLVKAFIKIFYNHFRGYN